MRRTQRSRFRLANALRVSLSAVQRQLSDPFVRSPAEGCVSGGSVSPWSSSIASSSVNIRSTVTSHARFLPCANAQMVPQDKGRD